MKGHAPEHFGRYLLTREPTSIEAETYAALDALGVVYERQRFIGHALVDAYIPATRTVIECQGDFFHCNPTVYPNGPIYETQRATIARDVRRFAYLRGRGFRVVELWESDIRQHGALSLIEQLL